MGSNQKRILMFGLAGSGKTYLITQFIKSNNNYIRLSGGSLINAELSDEDRDKLRKLGSEDILNNQNILIYNFKKECELHAKENIIFDGHLLVKSENETTIIPINVISSLNPTAMIFLDVTPEEILRRRDNDSSRPDRATNTIKEIKQERNEQIKLFNDYALVLGCPSFVLQSNPLDKMATFISKL